MPYIKQENRPEMDRVVEALKEGWLYDWELTYILFEYCKQHIRPSYNNYKNFCGELCQCATEIERRTGAKELSIISEVATNGLLKKREELCNKKIAFMKEGADIKVNGDLNYILYAYSQRHLITDYGIADYRRLCSEFSKALRLSAKRIESEILAKYEDQKIIENGDVF